MIRNGNVTTYLGTSPNAAPRSDFQPGDAVPWMAQGECRVGGYDPDLWFPEDEEYNGRPTYAAEYAIKVCERVCPVYQQCQMYALNDPGLSAGPAKTLGVWGGMTTGQRMRAKRRADKQRRADEWAKGA